MFASPFDRLNAKMGPIIPPHPTSNGAAGGKRRAMRYTSTKPSAVLAAANGHSPTVGRDAVGIDAEPRMLPHPAPATQPDSGSLPKTPSTRQDTKHAKQNTLSCAGTNRESDGS